MLFMLCGLSILCLVLSISKYKTVYNPYTIFNILWTVVGLLLIIGNKHVYSASNNAIIASTVGIIGFNLSSLSPRIILRRRVRRSNFNFVLNQSALSKLAVLVLILSLISASYAISQLFEGSSFSFVRENFYSYENSSSTLMYYLRLYFISPLRYVVTVGTVISFFQNREIKKTLLFCTIAIVLLHSITSGGRYVLMNTFYFFMCGYLMFNGSERIPRKQRVWLFFISVIIAYLIVYLTNDRLTYLTRDMNTLERLFQTIFEYFAGSVTYFGKVIETYPSIVGSTYGLNFIAGYLTPIFAMLAYLGLLSYPTVFSVIGTYACEVLQIGPYTFYNAMPSMFGYFFIDGGYILVFVEALLFGYICKRLYDESTKGNLLYLALYILVFIQICSSSQRWFFYSADYCLAFIYMRYIFTIDKHVSKHS